MHKENSSGQVGYPHDVEEWGEVSTPFTFLYIGPLVKTTSSNSSKDVPSSKSDWTLSRCRADSASATKKLYFHHNF